MKSKKLFILLILIEVCVNGVITLKFNPQENFEIKSDKIKDIRKILSKIEDLDDYRMYMLSTTIGEDLGFLLGFNSLSLFSSSYNSDLKNFIEKVNFGGGIENHINGYLNIPLGSLFGFKYYYDDNLGYFNCTNNICIDKNAMPFMYTANDAIQNIKLDGNFAENINTIYSGLLGRDIIISEKMANEVIIYNGYVGEDKDFVKDDKIKLEYVADKRVMIIFNSSIIDIVDSKLYINGENKGKISTTKSLVLNKGDILISEIDCSVLTESDIVVNNLDNFNFITVDLDLYEEAIQNLNEKTNYINLNSNGKVLRGKITTGDDVVMITIPYDEALKIKVDGKKFDYFRLLDSLVGINVESGEHIIEIDYVPKGFKIGFYISSVTIILFVLHSVIKKKSIENKKFKK